MNYPGYTLVRREDCPEQHGVLTVLNHDVSGATVLLVENEDTNKAFGIGFAVLAGVPLAAILLFISNVGVRLALIVLFLYAAAIIAAPVFLGFFLGALLWLTQPDAAP